VLLGRTRALTYTEDIRNKKLVKINSPAEELTEAQTSTVSTSPVSFSKPNAQTMDESMFKRADLAQLRPRSATTDYTSGWQRGKDGTAKFICKFIVGIKEDRHFSVCRRLIGNGGENMKKIVQAAGWTKIRLRGSGSKFLEGAERLESTEPLQLCVSATSQETFDVASKAVAELLERVHEEYRNYCCSQNWPVPDLVVECETQRFGRHLGAY
jgi:hypothetical protein